MGWGYRGAIFIPPALYPCNIHTHTHTLEENERKLYSFRDIEEMSTTEDITNSNNFTAGYECAVDLKLAYTYILYII